MPSFKQVSLALRQRHWVLRERIEIGDHVRALLVARQACEGHSRAGNVGARIAQPFVERGEGPFAALGLQGGGVVEARNRSDRAIDDAVEVGPDFGALAFLDVVANLTLLCDLRAALNGGAGKEVVERL